MEALIFNLLYASVQGGLTPLDMGRGQEEEDNDNPLIL